MNLKTKIEQILGDYPHVIDIKDGSKMAIGFEGVTISLGLGATRREMVIAEHLKDDPQLGNIITQFVLEFETFC